MSSNTSQRLDDPTNPPQMWFVEKPWVDDSNVLGEGPYYETSTNSIRWHDIYGKKIHWVDLKKGPSSLRSVEVQDPIGVTSDIYGDSENIFVAAKYGFGTVNKQTGKLTYVKRWYTDEDDEKVKRLRFNDGAVDSRGRFWAGNMTDHADYPLANEGAVYLLEADLTSSDKDSYSIKEVISPAMIPNGIGWSPKKPGKLYYTDSTTRTIWQFDYDEATGAISNREPWFVLEGSISIPTTEGGEPELFTFDETMLPDGFQFDEHGHLWSAIWGGGMILRIEDRGTQRVVTGVVRVPVVYSTCPRFVPGGGMVITTAQHLLPTPRPRADPDEGKTFYVDIGVEGSETWEFRRPVSN